MPGELNGKELWAFQGDYHPVWMMLENGYVFRPKWSEQTGPDLAFAGTYNDRVGITTRGRGAQPTAYYREASSDGVIQVEQHSEDHLRWARVATVAGQAGTGDPSPDNVRPITAAVAAGGAVNLRQRGKNLWPHGILTNAPTGKVTLPAGTYTFSIQSVSDATLWRFVYFVRKNGVFVTETSTIPTHFVSVPAFDGTGLYYHQGGKYYVWGDNRTTLKQTIQLDSEYEIQWYIAFGNTNAATTGNDAMIEPGATATPYEPYTGDDYSLTVQQAMYGLPGAEDWIAADGTEGHISGFYEFDGTEAWQYRYTSNGFHRFSVDGKLSEYPYGSILPWSSIGTLPHAAGHSATIHGEGIQLVSNAASPLATMCYLCLSATRIEPTGESVKAWLAARHTNDVPVQVLYQRATPLILPGTPQTVALAPGTNNIWSDVGTLSIGYQLQEGAQTEGDIASPTPRYQAPIIGSAADLRVESRNLLDVNVNYVAVPYSTINNSIKIWEAFPYANGRYTASIYFDARQFTAGDLRIQYYIFASDGTTEQTQYVTLNAGNAGRIGVSFDAEQGKRTQIRISRATTTPIDSIISASDVMLTRGNTPPSRYSPYRPPVALEIPELRAIPATYNPDGSVATWAAWDTLETRLVDGVWHWILTPHVGVADLADVSGWGFGGVLAAQNCSYFYSGALDALVSPSGYACLCTRFRRYDGLMTASNGYGYLNDIAVGGASANRIRIKTPMEIDSLSAWAAWRTSNHPILWYILANHVPIDLGPIDLPSHYPHTNVLTLPNASTVDGLLPETTARVRVVDA